MNRLIFLFSLMLIYQAKMFGQCSMLEFTVQDQVCMEESVVLKNTSVNGSEAYSWDFCSGDFEGNPTASVLLSNGVFNGDLHFNVYKSGGEYFGFGTDISSGDITRVAYGKSLSSTPQVSVIPNSTGLLKGPEELELYQEEDNWYGIVGNAVDNKLYRLDFGSSLSSTPAVSEIHDGSKTRLPFNIELHQVADSIVGIVTSGTSSEYYVLDFGASITNTPKVVVQSLPVSVSNSRGFSMIEECGSWYGLISSLGDNKLYKLSFGEDLSSGVLSMDEIAGYGFSDPFGLKLLAEGGAYYGFLQQRGGDLIRINFGNSISNVGTVSGIGKLGILESTMTGFTIVGDSSKWYGFAIRSSSNNLYRLDFSSSCSASQSLSTEALPLGVSYSSSGTYKIGLKAVDANGHSRYTAKDITVGTDVAPDISFNVDASRCTSNVNEFTSANNSGDLTSYSWDFDGDDVEDSSDPNPSYQYSSSGTYKASLKVSNGVCENTYTKELTIYPAPGSAGFDLPSGSQCSLASILFENTTDTAGFGRDGLQYHWDFNGEGTSSERNPEFIFLTSGMKDISLVAYVPGCSTSVVTQQLELFDGVEPSFNYTHNCLGEGVVFINETSTANVVGYQWTFGDGGISTESDPVYTYTSEGDYVVNLTIETTLGCQISVADTVSVSFDPLAGISYNLAEVNVPVNLQGEDLTGLNDEVVSWQWNYGGEVFSSDQDASIVFDTPDDYQVSLEVTTRQGCDYTVDQEVSVVQAQCPYPDFETNKSSMCIGENVVFTNTSVNGPVAYSWDFCSGDFEGNPTASVLLSNSVFNGDLHFNVYKSGGEYFGFGTDISSGDITRIAYGKSLSSTPQVSVIPNSTGLLKGPEELELYQEEDNWYGIVGNAVDNKLYRLDFGSSLSSTPAVSEIHDGSKTRLPFNIELHQVADSIVGIVTSGTSSEYYVLDFGASITNTPKVVVQSLPVSVSNSRGFSMIEECGSWYGLISSLGDNKLYKLSFGEDLSSGVLSMDEIAGYGFSDPFGLKLLAEGGAYYGFLQQRGGDLIRINFGNSISNVGTVSGIGKLGILESTMTGFTIVGDSSKWYGFAIRSSSNNLYRLDFSSSCSASQSLSREALPLGVSYTQSGTYQVGLKVTDAEGRSRSTRKSVTVTSETAPPISFLTTNIDCATSTATFQADTTLGDFESLQWDFGDGATATGYEVSHQFGAAGFFDVSVTGSNTGACSNTELREINIFATPVNPDFRVETEQFCTGSQVTMVNLSDESGYDGELIDYLWQIGDESYTDREPLITFDTPGTYNASLIVNIPGCESEPIDTTFTIESSTAAAFAYETDCEGNPVIFENLVEDTGTQSYLWDFGDGFQSTEFAPNYTYASSGLYQVTQQVIANNGCVRTETEQVEVLDIPTINFQNTTGCAGNLLELTDESVVDRADIVQRYWYLDDAMNPFDSGISASFTPEQGTYEVTLSVLATNGCSSEGSRSIHVDESPEAALDIANTCNGEIWTFTDESPNPSRLIDRAWYINGIVQENTSKEFIHLFDSPGTYTVALEVTGVNFCPTTVIREVEVLGLPDVRIQSSDGCAGDDIVLTDSLVNINDAIVSRTWFVDGERIGNGPQAVMENYDEGSYEVNVQMMSAKGCTYEATRIIRVQPVPEAEFTLNEDFGIHPFTLNSIYPGDLSNEIAWYLDGELVDTTASLNYTFDAPGAYQLDLVVRTDQGCRDSASTTIRSIIPEIDLDLRSILVEEIEEDIRFSAIIQNRSNLPLDNFRLKVQFEDQFPIYQDINRRINDGSTIREDLDFNLSTLMNIDYICFSLVSTDFDEEDLRNNEFCLSFRENAQLIEAYPNPTDRYYTFKVVSPSSGEITVTLVDLVGRVQKIFRDNAVTGLNQYELDLVGIEAGVYSLIIQTQTGTLKTRIVKQ